MPRYSKEGVEKSPWKDNYKPSRSHAAEMQRRNEKDIRNHGLYHGSFVVPDRRIIDSIVSNFQTTLLVKRDSPPKKTVREKAEPPRAHRNPARMPENSLSSVASAPVRPRRESKHFDSVWHGAGDVLQDAKDLEKSKAIESRLWHVQYQRD